MDLPEFLQKNGDGVVHVTGHRVGLQDLLSLYHQGCTAEMLLCEYPTLPLSTIYKVIAFYLDHRAVVDRYLEEVEGKAQAARTSAINGPGIVELRDRLAARPTGS